MQIKYGVKVDVYDLHALIFQKNHNQSYILHQYEIEEWKKSIKQAASINISEEGKKAPFKDVEGKKVDNKAPCSLLESFDTTQASGKLAIDVGELTGIFRPSFFILKDNVLFRCGSQKDEFATDAIELEDYSVNVLNEEKFFFELAHPTSPTWKLKAENKEQFSLWTKAIQKELAVIQDFSDNLKADAMIEEQKLNSNRKKKKPETHEGAPLPKEEETHQ